MIVNKVTLNNLPINRFSNFQENYSSSKNNYYYDTKQKTDNNVYPISKAANSALRSLAFAGINFLEKDRTNITPQLQEKIDYNKKVLNTMFKYDRQSQYPMVKSVKEGFVDKLAKRMALYPNKPLMVAITGESASGKTTLTDLFMSYADRKNVKISLLKTDNYFKDLTHLLKKHGSYSGIINSGYEIDSPNNFYLDDLKQDITDLANGKNIKGREYYMDGTCKSVANCLPVQSNKIVFVEGTAAMLDDISDLFDVKIYVETDDYTRKDRMLKRAPNRGHSPSVALQQWEMVKAAGEKYVKPFKEKCDIVLEGGHNMKNTSTQVNNTLYDLYMGFGEPKNKNKIA
ncbi:hypothetical protein IJG72_02410 [bacterium]|nr:hypothetical protein [bacterium]